MGAAKFTFDTVFAAEDDRISDAARARKRITLSQGEIDGMLALARNEGMNEATVRAMEATSHAARDAVGAIEAATARLTEEIESVREQAALVALAAARKLAHGALANFAAEEVEVTLREAMHQAIGEPRVVLRASQGVADALRERLADIAHDEGFEGRVQITADPTQKNADCRIEWRGGGVERSESAIEQAISALITRHFPGIPVVEN